MPAGALPPAPPPSPSRHRIKQGGLVSGTGRLKHVKRRQHQLQQQHHSSQPQPQIQQAPTPPSPQPLTPREQFAQFYGFTLPPPPPLHQHQDAGYPYEYQGGIIKPNPYANSIANSDSSSSTASSSSNSNSSVSPDRRANGTYFPPQPTNQTSFPPPTFRRSASYRVSTSAPGYLSNHDELLAKFNDQFIHSRTKSTSTPEPPPTPTKRERSIVPHGAEGKLVVPDVNLKIRCSSLESAASSRRSSSSRKSPLSAPSNVHEFEKQVFPTFSFKRPAFETRSWSYDNVQTYPIMKVPPKKEIRIVKKIVDGEEQDVEIEVEVYEEPKKLFNFAPKAVRR